MDILKFDSNKKGGSFKPMNAVNNGPAYKAYSPGYMNMNNLETYKAARIPYARNHDATFCDTYGGKHTVDISAIFPDFDADVNDPSSYDFECTDWYVKATELAGTKTFYRLGQTIEHYPKKYYTKPPKDNKKWAQICEHIIRHYTEGWADGFCYDMEYWEIWNEPDLHPSGTWQGSDEEFYDLYETAAKHLKSCFPHLKIGGPSLAKLEDWAETFLQEMHRRNVPIDFFSWHFYGSKPQKMLKRAEKIKQSLINNGYENAESILNEWNFVINFADKLPETIEAVMGMKGAAYTMACMSEAQKSDTIDMLMYYDARPSTGLNGMFAPITHAPLKGYYPFLWFSNFYGLEEIKCENQPEDIYTLCGSDENGKLTAAVTYYTNDCAMPNRDIKFDFGKTDAKFEVYALNENETNEYIGTSESLVFSLAPNSCLLIKEL